MNTTKSAVSGPSPTPPSRRWYAWNEFKDLFLGKEERHRRLHGRLLAVLVLSLILNLAIATVLVFVDNKGGVYHNFGRAFVYTTEQLLAGGSSFAISTTSWWAHGLEVFLDIYMVTVVAAVAGSFASYFTRA
jgi:hypothetical protein